MSMEQKPEKSKGPMKSMPKKLTPVKAGVVAGCVVLGIIILPLLAININYLCWELQPPVAARQLVNFGRFVTVDNLTIHSWEQGTGETAVILIHGFAGNSYDWRFNIKALSEKYSVYAPDLPGFGYSDKPLDFDYTPDGYGDFLVRYMDTLGIGKAVLVGHSMGGRVAINTYLRHPSRVSGLALVAPGGLSDNTSFLTFDLMARPVLGDYVMSLNYRPTIEWALRDGVFYDNSFVTPDLVDTYFNVYRTQNARRTPLLVMRGLRAAPPYDGRTLGAIRCPTLIIWGQDDSVISSANAYRFAAAIPGNTLLMLPRAGHMAQVEKADAVNSAIGGFVK
jgi:pimeloyl-ACP methyl ester carboxylesterase